MATSAAQLKEKLAAISAHVEMEDDLDFDGSSEDGGVAIDQGFPVDQSHAASSTGNPRIPPVARYMQLPINEFTDPQAWLRWQLPQDVPELRNKQSKSIDYRIHQYYQNCKLITRNWNHSSHEAVPVELRNCTPYSLALLRELRRFASHLKGGFDVAQQSLLKAWQGRMLKHGFSDDNAVALVWTDTSSIGGTEDKIQENLLGLTIADVHCAYQSVLPGRRSVRQTKQQTKIASRKQKRSRAQQKAPMKALLMAANAVTLGSRPQAEVAEEIVGKHRAKRKAKISLSQHEPEAYMQFASHAQQNDAPMAGGFMVPPNSPVLATTSKKWIKPGYIEPGKRGLRSKAIQFVKGSEEQQPQSTLLEQLHYNTVSTANAPVSTPTQTTDEELAKLLQQRLPTTFTMDVPFRPR